MERIDDWIPNLKPGESKNAHEMAVKIISCEKEKDLQNYVNTAGHEHFFVCKILYSTPIFNHLKMKCVALFVLRSNSFPRIISVTFPILAIMKR